MIIAYIYDGSQCVAQIMPLGEVSISEKLSDISTASFTLHNTSEYCTSDTLKLYRRVTLREQRESEEILLFDGVIRGFDGDINTTRVMLESLEHILDRRILQSDISHGGSVTSLVQYLISSANASGTTGITSVQCPITTSILKEYKQGDTLLSILKDLATSGYEFLVRDGVLIFSALAGTDRTLLNDDYREYVYSVSEPGGRAIDSVTLSIDGKELVNGVLARASAYSYQQDASSIAEYGLLQSAVSVSGDEASGALGYLDTHKSPSIELQCTISVDDYTDASIGDKVRINIDTGNDLMRYDGPVRIVSKTATFGDITTIQYGLSTTRIRTKNILEQIADLTSAQKKSAMY